MSTRKKVIVEYEDSSGTIFDANGMNVGTWHNLEHFGEPDAQGGSMKPRDLIALKEAGFTAEDLVTMRDGGVI
ncbi:hypothetical protein O4H29_06940 [Marinobacter salarius]|uniref:hypothetical protein n=1 Tax=Marinobacter salarius TaxID=1420917 RepID=UPI0022B14D38|nr:hypothetical protein [Marinobacter salarius]MCZ4284569.1 hypothetical protein [Marinobacter salarius]